MEAKIAYYNEEYLGSLVTATQLIVNGS
eukprot:COSAG06_NODE_59923_length_272_cov_1.358382_1_plen_27_part_01